MTTTTLADYLASPGADEAALVAALRGLLPSRGAYVRMNADDAAQNYTTEAAISFDVADNDTDSFWSAGTPNRLTIPAGVSLVSVSGQIFVSSSTADNWMVAGIIQYNSSSAILRRWDQFGIEQGSTAHAMNINVARVPVSAGDYFELRLRLESDTSVTVEGNDVRQTYMALTVLQ